MRRFLRDPYRARLITYVGFCLVVSAMIWWTHYGQVVNCHRIEKVKGFIRTTTAYDPAQTREAFAFLHINPDSDVARQYISRAKAASRKIQDRFAAKPC